MVGKIKLYTSLPPAVTRRLAGTEVGQTYLAQCVQSGGLIGVASLNSADEIEARVGWARCRTETNCRNRPTIADSGRYPSFQGSGRCHHQRRVFPSNNPELLNAVMARSADGMTMIERINIDPTSLWRPGRAATIRCLNISYRTPCTIDLDFGLVWSAVVVYGSLFHMCSRRQIDENRGGFFHLDHPQKWDQGQWIANGQKTVRYFLISTGALPNEFAAEIAKFSGPSDMSKASWAVQSLVLRSCAMVY